MSTYLDERKSLLLNPRHHYTRANMSQQVAAATRKYPNAPLMKRTSATLVAIANDHSTNNTFEEDMVCKMLVGLRTGALFVLPKNPPARTSVVFPAFAKRVLYKFMMEQDKAKNRTYNINDLEQLQDDFRDQGVVVTIGQIRTFLSNAKRPRRRQYLKQTLQL